MRRPSLGAVRRRKQRTHTGERRDRSRGDATASTSPGASRRCADPVRELGRRPEHASRLGRTTCLLLANLATACADAVASCSCDSAGIGTLDSPGAPRRSQTHSTGPPVGMLAPLSLPIAVASSTAEPKGKQSCVGPIASARLRSGSAIEDGAQLPRRPGTRMRVTATSRRAGLKRSRWSRRYMISAHWAPSSWGLAKRSVISASMLGKAA